MKRERRYTPGPWSVMNSAAIWLIYGADEVVTRVAKIFITLNRSERKANAALIAAAPELLEALEVARERLGQVTDVGVCPDYGVALQIDAAIAKAYGEGTI